MKNIRYTHGVWFLTYDLARGGSSWMLTGSCATTFDLEDCAGVKDGVVLVEGADVP